MFLNGEKPKTMRECAERLKKGCELLVTDEYGYTEKNGIFNPPATEEMIIECEKRLGFALPEAYKEFVRVSNGGWILKHEIYGTEYIGMSDKFVPEGYLSLSYTEMTSERLAFSKSDGKLYVFWDLEPEPWEFENYLMNMLENCEEQINEHDEEVARQKRREAGITEEQEYEEIRERIRAAKKKLAEKKENKE